MKLKKFVMIILVAMLASVYVFAEGEKEFEYSMGDIDKILADTQTVNNSVKSLSDNYIVKNVQKINKLISEANGEVEENRLSFFKKENNNKIDRYLENLDRIATFTEDIKKNKEKVKSYMNSYITTIDSLKNNISDMLQGEKADLKLLKKEYEDMKYSNGGKVYQNLFTGQETLIDLCEKRIVMIESLIPNYNKLKEKYSNLNEKIDLFVESIDMSSRVYRASYNTAKLSKNIKSSYDVFEEFGGLNEISYEIQESWKDMQFIIDMMVETSVDIE